MTHAPAGLRSRGGCHVQGRGIAQADRACHREKQSIRPSERGVGPPSSLSHRRRARAIRRAGELLKQIEPGQGARDGKREAGNHPPLRSEIAREAGMSPHQTKQAGATSRCPGPCPNAGFPALPVGLPPEPSVTACAAPPESRGRALTGFGYVLPGTRRLIPMRLALNIPPGRINPVRSCLCQHFKRPPRLIRSGIFADLEDATVYLHAPFGCDLTRLR